MNTCTKGLRTACEFCSIEYCEDRKTKPQEAPRPRIVCLCGSTRFMDAFQAANLQETIAGRIVLSIGCNTKNDDDLIALGGLSVEAKKALDELHKRKIDLADEILVLNVGGYIGESTRSEIVYAKIHNKPVRYLEPQEAPPECMACSASGRGDGPCCPKKPQEAPQAEAGKAPGCNGCKYVSNLEDRPCYKCSRASPINYSDYKDFYEKPAPVQSAEELASIAFNISFNARMNTPEGCVKTVAEFEAFLKDAFAAQRQAGREEAIQECNACSEMILADERSIVAEKLQAHYSAVVKATRELNEAVKKLPANDGRICGLIPIITRVDDALIDLGEVQGDN